MGTISINYNYLSGAASNLKNGASACRRYSDQLQDRCLKKLDSIEGGVTGYVWDAYSDVSTKRHKLEAKADRLDTVSEAIERLKDYARQTDQDVSDTIERQARDFQTANGMENSWIESAWAWLCDGVSAILNATEFGQAIADAFRKAGDWIADKWRHLRLWVDYDGGKFLVGMAAALAGIVAAVVTIATAGVGILAVIAVIGGVISLLNGIVKFKSNWDAWNTFQEDPYAAERAAQDDTLSDLIRTAADGNPAWADTLNFIAGTLDFVDNACAVIGLVDSVTKIYDNLTGTQSLFQKYLGQGGVVDSIFVKDVSIPGTKGYIPRQFDVKSSKWYNLDWYGNYADEVDFSKAKGLQWSWSTGFERLKTEIFPSSSLLEPKDVKKVTGFNMIWSQFQSDWADGKSDTFKGLSNLANNLRNMAHNGTKMFSYDMKTLGQFFKGGDIANREHFLIGKAILDDGKDLFKTWSGLDKIDDFMDKYKDNKVEWTDTLKLVGDIKSIPSNINTMLHLDWFEVGDLGKINKNIDKISSKKWSELYENIRQNIYDLGRPNPQPAAAVTP